MNAKAYESYLLKSILNIEMRENKSTKGNR